MDMSTRDGYPIGGHDPGDEPRPTALAEVQADDAMLDRLFVLVKQAEDSTRPDVDLDEVLARALATWRAEIESEPITQLVDVDTARAVLARARGPAPRRRTVRVPRWAHRVYALLGGYRWSPCPSCERPFGGHEGVPSPHRNSIPMEPALSRLICPACTARGVGCRAHAQLRGTYHGGCEFAPPPRDGSKDMNETAGTEIAKGSWWPEMPPALPGEDDDAYTNRLLGKDTPYDHHRNRQCSIGYHEECSDPRGERCECPCHRAQELHVLMAKVAAKLREQDGVLVISYSGQGWVAALEWGREAPDSPMRAAASYGTGETPLAALQQAVDQTGWER